MKYTVDVLDSYGNDSTHEVHANNVAEARHVARNLHIMEKSYKDDRRIPVITTEVLQTSE